MSELDLSGAVDLSQLCDSRDADSDLRCTLQRDQHDGTYAQHEAWRDDPADPTHPKLQARWVD